MKPKQLEGLYKEMMYSTDNIVEHLEVDLNMIPESSIDKSMKVFHFTEQNFIAVISHHGLTTYETK